MLWELRNDGVISSVCSKVSEYTICSFLWNGNLFERNNDDEVDDNEPGELLNVTGGIAKDTCGDDVTLKWNFMQF